MSEHFQAIGWSPKPPEQQELWRSRLEQWLRRTVQSGEFDRRQPMQTWQDDGFEQKLWNFMAMGDVLQSKGYVGWLWMERSFAPRPGAARVTEEIVFWEAGSCSGGRWRKWWLPGPGPRRPARRTARQAPE